MNKTIILRASDYPTHAERLKVQRTIESAGLRVHWED